MTSARDRQPNATAHNAANGSNEVERWQSSELFRHNRRLIIEHRGEAYCLRLTRNERLILNKL